MITAGVFALSQSSFMPEGDLEGLKDWRTALFSQQARKQRPDIALVLVNEDSLSQYPYISPVNRTMLARLVREIDAAGARVIGLDFVFDRATEGLADTALTTALATLDTPAVIGTLNQHPAANTYQRNFLALGKAKAGHAYLALDSDRMSLGDQVIRYMSPKHTVPNFPQSLAQALAGKPLPPSRLIDWLLPPSGSADLFLTFTIPPHQPGSAHILPPTQVAQLRNRIVLIGGGFRDNDRHLIPLALNDNNRRVSGAYIHAQIIAQLLDGRSLHTLPGKISLALVLLMSALGLGFGYWLGYRDERRRKIARGKVVLALWLWARGTLFWLLGTLVLGFASFVICFTSYKIIMATTALSLAFGFGLKAGSLLKGYWGQRFYKRFEQLSKKFQ